MSETAPTNNNQEYLEHHPDAVTDVDKARFMAEAELPYRERVAIYKRSAEMIGDAIIEGRTQSPDEVLKFGEENAHHANKTIAIEDGEIDTDSETKDEALTRKAGDYLYHISKIRETEGKTLNEFFEHKKQQAQEDLDKGRENAKQVGERYDRIKQRLDDIK